MNLPLLPLLDRELRVAARSPHTYSLRLSMALGAAVVSGFMFWVMNEMGLVAGGGGGFFRAMANVAYAYCLASGAALTIDCLSEEKRNGTLGLLFLTRLKSVDIVLGKLFACALRSLYGLLAALPVLSVCLMLGGVTYGEFGRVAISLLNALFFSLSAGMLASALCVNPVRASLLGMGLILGSGMILPVAATLLREEFNRPVLALALEFSSPYCGLRLAWDGVSAWERMIYWQSLLASLLITLLFLWMASWFLERAWQDKPVAGDADWRERWQQSNFGTGEARRMHRQRLLAINPIYWLGSRERFGTAGVWVVIGFIYSFGLFVWLRYFNSDNPVWIWLLAVYMADMSFKIIAATVASQRFWQDRQSGSLEMILATPLDVPAIVRGQWLVLRRHLLALVVTATLLNLAIILLLVWVYPDLRESRSLIFAAAGAFLLVSLADLVAVSWVGMWLALRVKKANSAGGYAIMFVVYPPLGVCLLTAMAGALFGVWSRWEPSPCLLIGLAAGVFLFNDLMWSLWARSWLYRNFRRAATDRYQPPVASPGWIEVLTSFFDGRKAALKEPPSIVERGESHLVLRRKIVIGVLTSLVLAGLGLWAYRMSLSREVAARLKAIQDGGAPVTVAALAQSQRGPAIEPSGTPLFLRAFAKLTSSNAATTNSHLFQGKFFDSRIDPLSPEMKAAAISIVRINADSLNLIRDGAKLPVGRYPFDWNNPMVTVSSLLPNVREAAQVLQIAAMLKGEEGEWPSALETVWELFAVARSLDREPLYFPQSVRASCLHRAVRSLERLVNFHSLTDSELADMAKCLQEVEVETLRASEQSYVAERCLGLHELQLPPAVVYQRQFGGGTGFERYGAGFFLGVRNFVGLRDREIIYYLRTYEQVLKTSRLPFPRRVREAIQIEESVAQARGGVTLMFSSSLLWSAVRPAAREAELCAHLRLAGTAVAIERYRLRHAGQLPDTLNELAPAWIVAVPFDPFDGKPLRYKKLPNGYCVYSVGDDGKDDGGLTKGKSYTYPDWVFTVERKQ